MIDFLHGTLVAKEAVAAVINVHGVGYHVHIPLSTFETLPAEGEEVRLRTHLHVREDAMQLFGFATEVERSLFRRLQGISGIGARMALNILSGVSPEALRERVVKGDVAALTRIPGIGKKTAERIVVELRDSFARESTTEALKTGDESAVAREEALMALQALGYARNVAEKAVAAVQRTGEITTGNASQLIKAALRELNSR
ncbi:MAG: Holliday junction branch migration protein RuvA [Bacteroidota bacterium]|nr:Holliday junction branch migration protein RuvA [Bacteroidota bacterium]